MSDQSQPTMRGKRRVSAQRTAQNPRVQPSAQRTMANTRVQPPRSQQHPHAGTPPQAGTHPHGPASYSARAGTPAQPLPPRAASKPVPWALILLFGGAALATLTCAAVVLGIVMIYGRGILPGVESGGVALGGMSESQAAAALRNHWMVMRLVDREQPDVFWNVATAQLGIALDADATARRAHAQGRGEGNLAGALTGIEVAPVLAVDLGSLAAGLSTLSSQIDRPAADAGLRMVNGVVEAAPAREGRLLDVDATTAALRQNAAAALADGQLELVMRTEFPQVTDTAALDAQIERARTLLQRQFGLRVYDPVTEDSVWWDAAPEVWSGWLTVANGDLALDAAAVQDYLAARASEALDDTRRIDLNLALDSMQLALAEDRTNALIRVFHNDRQHTVQSGETIISIAWDYGVPYPWVQQANGGAESLSVGQAITIPSPDNFLQFAPVPDKRIVVSISQQRTWVYENDALKWEWVSSTGISSSPTWPGLYQIISHVPNAYAANWDLWMPQFMGVYQPIPGQAFTNGFHGFPTRGGGQLLWENSLGTRVTYGCILLSNTNAQLLYDWAEEGVVVEIQP